MNYEYYEKIYNDLKTAYNNTSDASLKTDIASSIAVVLDAMSYFESAETKPVNRLKFLKDEYSFVKNYKFLIEDIKDFASNSDNFIYSGDETINFQFTNKEILQHCHEFFATHTDDKTYNLFIAEFTDSNKNLNICNFSRHNRICGITLMLPYYRKCIISLFRTNTINDVPLLIHEYGHAIQYRYTKNRDLNSSYIFEEIISEFLQLLGMEYLSTIAQYQNKCNLQAWFSLSDMIENANNYINEYYILKEISKNYTTSNFFTYIKALSFLFKQDNRMIIDILRYSTPSDYIIYILGKMISIELLYLYRNDRKRCFKTLYKIMDIDLRLTDKDYYQEIKKLGITPNLHLSEYYSDLKRKLSFTTNIIKNTY